MDAKRANCVYAIVGSREFGNLAAVRDFVAGLPKDAEVISGGARGVDRVAFDCAFAYGLRALEIPAEWDRHGKAAGFIRNKELVERADVVVAFWDGKSRGTKHTIDLARKAGKEVHVFGKVNQSFPQVEAI